MAGTQAEPEHAGGSAEESPSSTRRASVLRVVVVEDSEDDFDLLLQALRKGGYRPHAVRVETAEGLEEALRTESWDVIISDWSMPAFSAQEAIEMMQKLKLDLPFIIVSGTVGEDTAVRAMRAGAHDFIVKHNLVRLVPAIERELRDVKVRAERATMHEQLLVSDRMASIGILAAGVAHEINNPLAALLANLEMASREVSVVAEAPEESARLREVVEELRDCLEAGVRIRDIVRDLKVFSRSEDEKRMNVNVHDVLDSAIRMAHNEIRHRACVVKDYAEVPMVYANESRLGQVFLNLVVNAAQAITEGNADANEIRITTGLDEQGRVRIDVRDTGAGMPPKVLSEMFTPFFTTKPVGVGTGLGLSISHRIVTSLEGEITVASTPGQGSTFSVCLPPSLEPSRLAEHVPGSIPNARRGRVLVVDDEAAVCTAIERIVGDTHEVVSTVSASDALAMLADGVQFDVILCDLMMPEMTGMDLYDKVRSAAPDQAGRMVFLTGGAFTHRAREFLDRIANAHLEKPFALAELLSVINERVR